MFLSYLLLQNLYHDEQGISFHKVNKAIDKGDLYYQEKVTNPELIKSMIAFYFYVHTDYYKMLAVALKNITADTVIPTNGHVRSNYNSLPTPKDYKLFKKNGGRVINWKDIFLPAVLFSKD